VQVWCAICLVQARFDAQLIPKPQGLISFF
jgi:hypothetical protein